jgi:hypothetical protein
MDFGQPFRKPFGWHPSDLDADLLDADLLEQIFLGGTFLCTIASICTIEKPAAALAFGGNIGLCKQQEAADDKLVGWRSGWCSKNNGDGSDDAHEAGIASSQPARLPLALKPPAAGDRSRRSEEAIGGGDRKRRSEEAIGGGDRRR